MAKRGGSLLNHENWNQEEEREEAGVFTAASASEMKGRVIKKARRRNAGGDSDADGPKKSAFGSFGGFGAPAGGNKETTATFNFLNKVANETAPASDKPAFGAFSFGSSTAATAPSSFSFGSAATTKPSDTGGDGMSTFGAFGSASNNDSTKPAAPAAGLFSSGAFGGTTSPAEKPTASIGGFAFGAGATSPTFGSKPEQGKSEDKPAPVFGGFGSNGGTATVAPVFGSKPTETPSTSAAPAFGAFAFGSKPSTPASEPKSESPPVKSTSPVKSDFSSFKAPAGWSCGVCMINNPVDKTKCLACETPKPGSAPAKEESSSFKFGAGTVTESPKASGSSPFSFGVKAVEKTDSTPTSGFSFGSKPAEVKPVAAAAAFSFGSKPEVTKSDSKPEPEKSSSAACFSFGSSTSSGAKDSEKAKESVPAAAFSFGAKTEASKAPSSTFAFGSNSSATKDKEPVPATSFGSPSTKPTAVSKPLEKNDKPSVSNEYLSHIKALNNQVLAWLKSHIERDPLIILSPVFKDYDKHLEDINKQFRDNKKQDNVVSSVTNSVPKETVKSVKEPEASSATANKPNSNSDSVPAISPFSFGAGATAVKPVAAAAPSTFSFGASQPTTTASSSGTSSFSFSAQTTTAASATSSTFTFNPSSSSSAPAPAFGSGFGAPAAGGFSFGAGGFGAAAVAPAATEKKDEAEDEEDQPPVVEVKQVEESDALYSKKCKLFYKKDGNYVEKGVGMLHLKSVDGGKTQLLVRADTNLGNVLLNILLSSGIPTTRVGKNNVMLVCVPNPPVDPKVETSEPCPMLIRVKTGDDADELKAKLDEFKDK